MRTVALLLLIGFGSSIVNAQTQPRVIQAECHTGADDVKCAVILDVPNDRDDLVKFVRQDNSAVSYTMETGMKTLNITDLKGTKIKAIEFRGVSIAITTTAQNITDEKLAQLKARNSKPSK